MRTVLLLVIGSLGCGRLGFDTPDAAADAHDEDGDGLSDRSDPCPHLAGDGADADGDGVGDACDPDPAVGGDRIRVFSTLQAGDHPFRQLGPLVQEADGLRYTGLTLGLDIDLSFVSGRFEVGFEILGQVGTDQHQIACGVRGTDPYYFVELNEHLGAMNVAITSYDGVNGYVNRDLVPTSGVHPGEGILRFDAATAPPRFTAVAGWIGELYNAAAPAPGYTGGTPINLVLNGIDVVLRYVIIMDRP